MSFNDVSVKESPGLCRCCLSEGCYKDLGTEYTWMNENEVYADMLLDCFDIGITQHSDGPNGAKRLICEVCITRLRDACNFKKQVLDSEKKFVDMLGRGEFAPKVVLFPHPMKSETVEEMTIEDVDSTEVEYLDDIDYVPDEEVKEEEEITAPSSSKKRGRPKKEITNQSLKKQKVKEKTVKVNKETEDRLLMDKLSSQRKKDEFVNLVTAIIENSTVIPFRWHCSKYACFFCCCPFEESSKLIKHHKEEHSESKIRNVFRSLIKNCKLKLEISELKCKKCTATFEIFEDLLQHFVDQHSFKINLDLKAQLFTYKIADNLMVCHRCGEEFRSFGTLLKHTHAQHNSSEPYLCEICGQAFIAKVNVDSHVKAVHSNRNVTCEKCNQTFKNPNALLMHNRRTHRSYSLKCPKCPEILSTPYWKKKHLATVHDIKRFQYECNICHKMFTFRSKLVTHELRVHLKEKHFSCTYCSYKAFDKESLNKHMVSHDDTRPFQCEFCKKAFQRKKTYELHRRIHTNDRRYVCKDCGKAFVQCTSLKLHYRVHHSKEGPSWG